MLAVAGALTLLATALLACSSTSTADASAADGGDDSSECSAPKPTCYDACIKQPGSAFCSQGRWECTHTDPTGYFDCAGTFHQTNCDVPLTPDAVCDGGRDASKPADGGAPRDALADGADAGDGAS